MEYGIGDMEYGIGDMEYGIGDMEYAKLTHWLGVSQPDINNLKVFSLNLKIWCPPLDKSALI